MNHHAVVPYRDPGVSQFFALIVQRRPDEGDVVSLPVQRRVSHIHPGRLELIQRPAKVVLRRPAEAVQQLHLVSAQHVDATVAARLAPRVWLERQTKLKVQREGVKLLPGVGAFFQKAGVGHFTVDPGLKRLFRAIEKHHGILGRLLAQRRACAMHTLKLMRSAERLNPRFAVADRRGYGALGFLVGGRLAFERQGRAVSLAGEGECRGLAFVAGAGQAALIQPGLEPLFAARDHLKAEIVLFVFRRLIVFYLGADVFALKAERGALFFRLARVGVHRSGDGGLRDGYELPHADQNCNERGCVHFVNAA